jgi:type I restriction enzyme S subunit
MHSPWPYQQLGELVDVLDSQRIPVNSDVRYSRPGSVPYYGANGIQGFIDRAIFNEPLVLLAEDGGNFDEFATRPIAYRIDGPSWVNNHAHVIKAKTHVEQGFVYWSLVNRDIRRYIAGGTRTKLTQGELKLIELPVPPQDEQRRIAEILDTLDETIRKTEQLIAKLQQAKQGLLHDLLTRGIDDNGELRDPERHPEQFKDSVLGRIPKAWGLKRVGELLRTIEQGWSPDCSSNPSSLDQWGVLKTTAVVWDGFQAAENKALPVGLHPRPEYEVRQNDVLMTRAGPNSRVGVVALVEATRGKLMLSDKLYRLVPTAEVRPDFMVIGLSGEPTQRYLSGLKTGLAESQTNISQAIVRSLWFTVPSLVEQEEISTRVVAYRSRLSKESAELEKLRALKQGLMDDLLTGRVRVPT